MFSWHLLGYICTAPCNTVECCRQVPAPVRTGTVTLKLEEEQSQRTQKQADRHSAFRFPRQGPCTGMPFARQMCKPSHSWSDKDSALCCALQMLPLSSAEGISAPCCQRGSYNICGPFPPRSSFTNQTKQHITTKCRNSYFAASAKLGRKKVKGVRKVGSPLKGKSIYFLAPCLYLFSVLPLSFNNSQAFAEELCILRHALSLVCFPCNHVLVKSTAHTQTRSIQ